MSSLPDTLVVFGASGFVGRNFVERMSGKVERLIGVSARAGEIPGCDESWTIDRLDALTNLAPERTAIVHLAAFRYDSERFELAQADIVTANATLNSRVYQFAAERGIREVRAASSVAVYPADLEVMDDARPIDLNAPPHANEAFYAWSKRWLETLGRIYADRFGVNTVTFRLSNPYGPYDSTNPRRAHVAPAFVMKALSPAPEFEIRGSADVERDFTFVGDVVEIFRRSLERRGQSAVYNLCTGRAATLMELAQTAMKAAGVDKPIQSGAPGAFGPAARRSTSARLQADFNWSPTSLADGMAATVDWYRHAFKP